MKPILIIDPGHGGRDPGGGSNRHWKEKDLNLKISLYQYKRYQDLNIPVAITRKTDETLSAAKRTKIVRNSGAIYCHSNHINAGGGDGAEVIHSIYGGQKMAEAITRELRAAGQNIRRIFTRTLQSNSTRDYYYMNRETGKVQTSIIEYGFADSSLDDVRQLKNEWEKYAEAVVKAFCEFTNYPYTAERIVKQQGKDENTGSKKILYLPKEATSWRVYPLNKAPTKGNEKGFLNPAKFNGLKYEILGSPQTDVYLIQTRDFGKVQIYVHKTTGATIQFE